MVGKSQPVYIIEATRNCKTHRPGTRIQYVGPKNAVAKGWKVVSNAFHPVYRSEYPNYNNSVECS